MDKTTRPAPKFYRNSAGQKFHMRTIEAGMVTPGMAILVKRNGVPGVERVSSIKLGKRGLRYAITIRLAWVWDRGPLCRDLYDNIQVVGRRVKG